MSTTLLYHAFGIRGYKHISTKCRGGAVYFTVRQDRCDWCGPECGSHKVKPRGRVWRQWRLLHISRGQTQGRGGVMPISSQWVSQAFHLCWRRRKPAATKVAF